MQRKSNYHHKGIFPFIDTESCRNLCLPICKEDLAKCMPDILSAGGFERCSKGFCLLLLHLILNLLGAIDLHVVTIIKHNSHTLIPETVSCTMNIGMLINKSNVISKQNRFYWFSIVIQNLTGNLSIDLLRKDIRGICSLLTNMIMHVYVTTSILAIF